MEISKDISNYKMVCEENIPKRILFATIPSDGHFNPLTGLGVHLKKLGNDVRWYTSSIYAEKLANLNIKHYPLRRAFDIGGKSPEELFPERQNIKSKIKRLAFDLINGFILRAPEYYEDIKEIYKSFPFDVIVVDCMFFAIPFIKNKLNVPVISIGVVPLTQSSKDIAPPGLGLIPPSNFFQKRKYDVLGFITAVIFRKPVRVLRSILEQYDIPMYTENMFDFIIEESTLLLQLGIPGFEYTRNDLGKNIKFIGASLPHLSTNKQWHHAKLKQYSKIILVTQGTVETDVSKLIIPTLAAFKNTEYLVIVTTGGSHTNALREQFNYDNIIIEDFIPFAEIMPLVNLYISNGGYGGVMLGIKHKLPMVVAGIHEGKSEINARVGYFDIGINLRTERPSLQQIKTAALKVLSNPVYKYNIEILSEELSAYNANELCAAYINEALNNQSRISMLQNMLL